MRVLKPKSLNLPLPRPPNPLFHFYLPNPFVSLQDNGFRLADGEHFHPFGDDFGSEQSDGLVGFSEGDGMGEVGAEMLEKGGEEDCGSVGGGCGGLKR